MIQEYISDNGTVLTVLSIDKAQCLVKVEFSQLSDSLGTKTKTQDLPFSVFVMLTKRFRPLLKAS